MAYSPLNGDQAIPPSPPHSQPWLSAEGDLGSPESPGWEMRKSPNHRESRTSLRSATTIPPNYSENQSFLGDGPVKRDTSSSTYTQSSLAEHTGKQFKHILIGMSARLAISLGLFFAYFIVVGSYHRAKVLKESDKRMFNSITTAISIAVGLNIATAFKDMANYMRWPILSARKRNLNELDLILGAESLTNLAKLAFVARRPTVILACLSWLAINIAVQAAIAALSLTYGFDVNYNAVFFTPGNVTIPDMKYFYPQVYGSELTDQGQQYIAHVYGELAYDYGFNDSQYMPSPGNLYKNNKAMLWYSQNSSIEFIFSDSQDDSGLGTFSVYTNRTIEITYNCDPYEVIGNGNGTSNNIEVANIGEVLVDDVVPDSTTFFTNENNICQDSNPRCAVVEVFEASAINPWYYRCEITLGETKNDIHNISAISDEMAHMAASSIAQIGYTNQPTSHQQTQIYPQNSWWGTQMKGDSDSIGFAIALFGLGSIVGASIYNPLITYPGDVPTQGFQLTIGHRYFFYAILIIIFVCQFLLCTVVAILANRVMVGPDGHLSMSLLLRPIAGRLDAVSGQGANSQSLKNVKKTTEVRYEKSWKGRWILNTA